MSVQVVLGELDQPRKALSAYVLRTLLVALGLPHEVVCGTQRAGGDAVLCYGASAPAGCGAAVEVAALEPPTASTRIAWLRGVEEGRRLAFLGECWPVDGRALYRAEADGSPVVAIEGTRAQIGFDLVASANFWLTGGDETPERRDHFGRIRGAVGHRHEADLASTPVVTDLMNLLWECLAAVSRAAGSPLERVGAWPEGRRFALLLSHDVDLWRKRTARQLAKELLRSVGAPQRLGAVARAFCRGPDPWALGPIAELEAARGMRSTFFLLPGRRDRRVDGVRVVNGYRVGAAVVGEVAQRLAARGGEVALHASFDSFRSAAALRAERQELEGLAGRGVVGVRQHFLRLERPTTWRCQAEAGLQYDATLGYHDVDGYRGGFSFPFRPFDGEELPIWVLPLVVMDGVLLEQQGLDADAAWRRLERYLERTRADGAMLGLLWHNTHFCELDAPGYRGVYERALDWTRQHGGWGASAREVVAWWEQRSAGILRGS